MTHGLLSCTDDALQHHRGDVEIVLTRAHVHRDADILNSRDSTRQKLTSCLKSLLRDTVEIQETTALQQAAVVDAACGKFSTKKSRKC